MEKLDIVGAFAVLGMSPETMKDPQQASNINIGISDLDSDYDNDEEKDLDNDGEHDNFQLKGEPPMVTFWKDLMITGTSVLRWLPLGAICQKKKMTTKNCKLSRKSIIFGVTNGAIVYAEKTLLSKIIFFAL